MVPKDDTHLVADPKNGIVTPVYSDRQVVRASDLTLDRESHDAALARMRRLMHGWGIVSGFDARKDDDKPDTLILSPGYAIAPSGAEIFLPQEVALTNLVERIKAHCGDDPATCEDLTPDAQRETRARIGLSLSVQFAWLVARPAHDAGSPRPAVPAGCENPGNLQLPTRLCHLVRLELMCSLPDDKVLKDPSCPTLNKYICEGGVRSEGTVNPYPAQPNADCDFVVLGLVAIHPKIGDDPTHASFDGEEIVFGLANRRTVLPNSILQDFLHACVCPALHGQKSDAPDTPTEPEPDDDTDGPVITRPGWEVYRPLWERKPVAVLPDIRDEVPGLDLDDGHTDPPPYIYEEFDRLNGLKGTPAGTPEGFLRTDVEDLVIKTGMTPTKILTIKEEIVATEELWKTEEGPPAVPSDWGDFNAKMFDNGVSTNWNTTNVVPTSNTVRNQPLIVTVAENPAALREKGLAGPADVLAQPDGELAVKLGVTEPVAKAIKTDMMRFTGLMGR